jgi:hypothetical protein
MRPSYFGQVEGGKLKKPRALIDSINGGFSPVMRWLLEYHGAEVYQAPHMADTRQINAIMRKLDRLAKVAA